jgi:hypothetical protein
MATRNSLTGQLAGPDHHLHGTRRRHLCSTDRRIDLAHQVDRLFVILWLSASDDYLAGRRCG